MLDIFFKEDIWNVLQAAFESSDRYGIDYIHALNIIAVGFGLPKVAEVVNPGINIYDEHGTLVAKFPPTGLGTEVQT